MTGTAIGGRFDIEWLAASGGMGDVFRARDRLTGEPVAVKVVKVANPQRASRFAREALLLAELRHPAIARYVAHGETAAGVPYLAMEWLEGEDLAKRLRRLPLTAAEAVQVARLVADVLAFAHAAGVVHRDVKPSNILLDGGRVDRVRLLDFGIARHETSLLQLTRSGAMMGTLAYMSPEQCRGARAIDARADVFSLGCVLYECLTGRSPFRASHPLATMTRLFLDDPAPLRQARPEAPILLDELLRAMLAKSPAGRPRDAAVVAARLAELPAPSLAGMGAPPVSIEPAVGPLGSSGCTDTTEAR